MSRHRTPFLIGGEYEIVFLLLHLLFQKQSRGCKEDWKNKQEKHPSNKFWREKSVFLGKKAKTRASDETFDTSPQTCPQSPLGRLAWDPTAAKSSRANKPRRTLASSDLAQGWGLMGLCCSKDCWMWIPSDCLEAVTLPSQGPRFLGSSYFILVLLAN